MRRQTADRESPALRLERVARSLPGGRGAGPVDLRVDAGEVIGFSGPSGCGKSTLLRSIAGLDGDSSGRIEVDGVAVDRRPPGRRDITLVEQHLPLYEHLSARDNVDMAISGLRLDRSTRETRVAEALRILEVEALSSRRATELSGGERARICLARVVAREARVTLLDEPFAGLDEDARQHVRRCALAALRSRNSGVIVVTHDRDDLADMDRVVRFDDHGRVTTTSD